MQPHSGTQANMAVYFTFLEPGAKVLGMNLSHGGHLTHGHPINFSGKLYNIVPYSVNEKTEMIDYDALMKQVLEVKPKMIIAGASAYPRTLDFEAFRRICDAVGAGGGFDLHHLQPMVVLVRP